MSKKPEKSVPDLRFKGFTNDWEQRKFGDVFQKNSEKNNFQFSKEKTITIASMKFNENGNNAAEDSLKNYKVLRIGDIAFEGHANKKFKFGRFVLNDIGAGIMSPRFSTLRPVFNINIKYWKYYIHNDHIMKTKLVKSTKLGTMMNELVTQEFLNQYFKEPQKIEQEKIGNILFLLDKNITLHQRKLELLKQNKKFLLQNIFPKNKEKNPEIRFSEFNNDWEQRKLGEVADIIGGGTPSTSNSEYWDGDINWYSPAEIGEQNFVSQSIRKITEVGLAKSSAKLLPVGTVLFTSRAGIGKTAILSKKATTNQGFQSIVPHENQLDSYFIYSHTNELKKYGERVGAGSTFVEVSGKQMAKMSLIIPKIEEQKQIGSFFEQLDTLITLHQTKLEKLQNLKKFLLNKLFI